jgi:hypothetical protein
MAVNAARTVQRAQVFRPLTGTNPPHLRRQSHTSGRNGLGCDCSVTVPSSADELTGIYRERGRPSAGQDRAPLNQQRSASIGKGGADRRRDGQRCANRAAPLVRSCYFARMMHCSNLLTRASEAQSTGPGSQPVASRTPALVFSLIFTSAISSFAALQQDPSHFRLLPCSFLWSPCDRSKFLEE